ncbi:ead/Ea22-like family protein [Enterobacter hormaechei]|uniref:ead/Ea22-like family protein n=1 Tax=Enterobacter hormaechei TaxID=158836 RepID=UPI003315DDBF
MSNIDKRALREAAEKASTDNHTQDEWFHYLRCSTPETVLALLDELEKMQAQSSKWCEAFHKAVSVGARYEERIAELEAREVTLPVNITSANAPEVFEIAAEAERLGLRGTCASYAVGWNARGMADIEALREAGVNAAAAGKGE